MSGEHDYTERFYGWLIVHARWAIGVSLAAILGLALLLPSLEKDARNEAFFDPQEPALVSRDRIKEIFNLGDPVAIAVINEGPQGVFTPHTLTLVGWLTDELRKIDGVDPDAIRSLSTEKDIIGTEDSLIVEPFYEGPVDSNAHADAIREAVLDLELYRGRLVARDGSATLIVAEVPEQDDQQAVYEQALDVVARAPVAGEVLHVAGEGASTGYLGAYIDEDATRLTPIAVVVITLILVLAYRRFRGVWLPLLVVVGALSFALGSMSVAGIPFYYLTNAMPVILIAIAVCDGIHILGSYYERVASEPEWSSAELVVATMREMVRPVVITSVTTMVGFIGLSIPTHNPPIRWFGVFAAVGVGAALVFSLVLLPAVLSLLPPQSSRAFSHTRERSRADRMGAITARLGDWVLARPRLTLLLSLLLGVAGVLGVQRVQIDDERIAYFQREEPIYVADAAMNERFDGTNYIDVLIETDERDALLRPDFLRRIDALQDHFEGLPHVGGTHSVVERLKQISRSVNEDRDEAYALPDSRELVAQYFLLHSMSADSDDLEHEIDSEFQLANLRVMCDSGVGSDLAAIIEPSRRYIEASFATEGLRATISGTGNVMHEAVESVRETHPLSLLFSFVGVWVAGCFAFRSFVLGTVAIIPVSLAVVLMYAVMGFGGIWLSAGTSLAAAVSIGLAVDFTVHVLGRTRQLVEEEGLAVEAALRIVYPTTARALLFNFLAVALGFGVVMVSNVPSVGTFGALVATCVAASFVTSLTLLPAMLMCLPQRWLWENGAAHR